MRLYEMFIGDFEKAAGGALVQHQGLSAFLERFWSLQENLSGETGIREALETSFHKTIKKVGEDIETLKFNTAIASLMALMNEIHEVGSITRDELRIFCLLLNVFAPHIAEEVWEQTKLGAGLVCQQEWPAYDEAKCVDAAIEIASANEWKGSGALTDSSGFGCGWRHCGGKSGRQNCGGFGWEKYCQRAVCSRKIGKFSSKIKSRKKKACS